eukprot:2072775-Rhodomonas_salina.1
MLYHRANFQQRFKFFARLRQNSTLHNHDSQNEISHVIPDSRKQSREGRVGSSESITDTGQGMWQKKRVQVFRVVFFQSILLLLLPFTGNSQVVETFEGVDYPPATAVYAGVSSLPVPLPSMEDRAGVYKFRSTRTNNCREVTSPALFASLDPQTARTCACKQKPFTYVRNLRVFKGVLRVLRSKFRPESIDSGLQLFVCHRHSLIFQLVSSFALPVTKKDYCWEQVRPPISAIFVRPVTYISPPTSFARAGPL